MDIHDKLVEIISTHQPTVKRVVNVGHIVPGKTWTQLRVRYRLGFMHHLEIILDDSKNVDTKFVGCLRGWRICWVGTVRWFSAVDILGYNWNQDDIAPLLEESYKRWVDKDIAAKDDVAIKQVVRSHLATKKRLGV